jgi:hypothetical protein
LLKDSVPCPIPNYEKVTLAPPLRKSTLLIACRRSTGIAPSTAPPVCYPKVLLQKGHELECRGNRRLTKTGRKCPENKVQAHRLVARAGILVAA